MSTAFQLPEWFPVAEPPPSPPIDDHRVEALVNRFIAGKQEALFTAPDAFYRRSGGDAVEGAPAAVQRLTDLKSAILEQARDDGERAALGPRLDLHIEDANDGIDRHVAGQRRVHQRQILSERQALIRRAAELEHDNDAKISGLAEANASAAAELARIDREPEAPAMEAARSAVWRTAIDHRIAADKGPQAILLFDRVKDRLAPADRLSLDTPVQAARYEQAANRWIARDTGTDGAPLQQRLDADPSLPPQAKAIVRARIDARDSAAESRRVAQVQALDDQTRDVFARGFDRPSAYKRGTLARIADGYDAAGEPDRAAAARRWAAREPFLLAFVQASAERQQRLIEELPEGELRDFATALQGGQRQTFARDAFAAGTALYREVGPPVHIDDVEGRIRQARQIAQLRGGIPVSPFTLHELDQMQRTLANGSEQDKQSVRTRLAAVPVDMRPTLEPGSGAASTGTEAASPAGSAQVLSVEPGFAIDADEPAENTDATPSAGGYAGAPTIGPIPGSPEDQAADAEARRVVAQQEADERVADRLISAWIASTKDEAGRGRGRRIARIRSRTLGLVASISVEMAVWQLAGASGAP